jgi:hypothetical protein
MGPDKKAHLIISCDPSASAWVAVCGKIITGPETGKKGNGYCVTCFLKSEK